MPSVRRSSSAPVKILLIEYNRHGEAARRTLLQQEGYEIRCTRTVDAAIGDADGIEFQPKIVVLSNDSHQIGNLVRQVRDNGLPVPLVLLSSIADTAGLTTESTGADAVIQKSAQEIAELKRVLQRLLRKRPARSQKTKMLQAEVPSKKVSSAKTSLPASKRRA
jgi:DNA-binding response OmpR family regulator